MSARHHPLRRAVIVAAVGAIVILVGGWAAELWRFGPTTEASYARVERDVIRTVDEMVASLERAASYVATHPEVTVGLGSPDARPLLFEIIRGAIDSPGNASVSVTVYDAAGVARAWAGRPSEIPSGRVLEEESLFVAPGPLGLRLVHVQALRAPTPSGGSGRVGSLAVERVLSPAGGITEPASDLYQLSALIADVSLRTVYEGAGSRPGPFVIEVQSPSGELLLEGEVSEADLVGAREAWRRAVRALTLVLSGLRTPRSPARRSLSVRPAGSPLVRLRSAPVEPGPAACSGYGLLRRAVGLGMVNASVGLFDASNHVSNRVPALIRSPADLLLLGVVLACLFLVGAFVIDQVRLARRHLGGQGGQVPAGIPVCLSFTLSAESGRRPFSSRSTLS